MEHTKAVTRQFSFSAFFAFFAVKCLLVLFFAVGSSLFGQSNDQFNNRIALIGTNITVKGTNNGASKQPGEPDHAGNPGGASVWWAWTAPTNGELVITTDGSSFDTLLGVYTGSPVSALSVVASNDDHGVFDTSRVRFEALAGIQYQIAVDGFNDGTNVDSGSVSLHLSFISEPIVRPPNDNFTNAIALTGRSVLTNGSNVEGTREPGEPLHAGKPGDTSVWWTWTAAANDTVRVTTDGSTFDTLLAIYTGSSVLNLTLVASNDDTDPANGILTSTVVFNVTVGQTYQIAVDGYDGASGQVSLRIDTVTVRLSGALPLEDGTFQFSVNGSAGAIYKIDATTDFGTWSTVGLVTNVTDSANFVDSTATNANRRFYRAQLKP